MNIGGVLYIDMSTDELIESNINQLVESIQKYSNKKIIHSNTNSQDKKEIADIIKSNNFKNKLEELDYDSCIAMLVLLGCPENIENRILKNYNRENFDGKLLSLISNETEFVEEFDLQDLKSLLLRKIFTELQRIKTYGIEEKLLQQINKMKNEAVNKNKVIQYYIYIHKF